MTATHPNVSVSIMNCIFPLCVFALAFERHGRRDQPRAVAPLFRRHVVYAVWGIA
jgi:hypothetical protein